MEIVNWTFEKLHFKYKMSNMKKYFLKSSIIVEMNDKIKSRMCFVIISNL